MKTDRDGFFQQVYEVVRQVPEGMVATYGQIAALAGAPRRARYVGYALHANPEPGTIPCHRVVFADGRLAEGFAFGGPQRSGRCWRGRGRGHSYRMRRVDLATCRWPAGVA